MTSFAQIILSLDSFEKYVIILLLLKSPSWKMAPSDEKTSGCCAPQFKRLAIEQKTARI